MSVPKSTIMGRCLSEKGFEGILANSEEHLRIYLVFSMSVGI